MIGENKQVTSESLGAGVDSGQALRGTKIGDLEHTAVGVDQHVITLQDPGRGNAEMDGRQTMTG